MSRCEPNLFATSLIPHSLSCVMCILVLAFTFALCFIPKCDVLYINVVSAIVTFFLFYLLKAHLEVSHHDVQCPAGTSVVCISVSHKKKILKGK